MKISESLVEHQAAAQLIGKPSAGDMIELSRRIRFWIQQGNLHVVVDLSRAKDLTWEDMGALMQRGNELKSLNGNLKLVGVDERSLRMLKAIKADRCLEILTHGSESELLSRDIA